MQKAVEREIMHRAATLMDKRTGIIVLLCLGYFALAATALYNYLPWTSVNFILGICAIPVIIQKGKYPTSYRFGFITVLFAILSYFIPVQTFLYFTIISAILWIIESVYGRLPVLLFFNLILISPIASYFISVFSFPIRLEITSIAGIVMNSFGLKTIVAGNTVSFNAKEYVVDPACMGLNMLLSALLSAILIIAAFCRKTLKTITAIQVIMILSLVLVFTIISNFFRILFLVYFDIKETALMHELTGLACFTVYVLLPSFWMIRFFILRFGTTQLTTTYKKEQEVKLPLLLHAGLLILISFIGYHVYNKQHANYLLASAPKVNGYKETVSARDIIQYRNKSSLVYLKKIHGFYYSDHNPVICWTGSGYTFSSMVEMDLVGSKIFTGVLNKGKEKLYTAWWYDNGISRTNSQLAWRWNSVKTGKEFSVVNVTTDNQEVLYKEVSAIITRNVFIKALR
jgi:exosortase N